MDRVSNKWLENVIRLHELGGIGSDLDHAAFCELRDRRAAEQNVTTADLNLGPVTRLRVSDEELCRVGEVFALDSVTNSIIYGVPMRHLSLIVDEVIERRAAEREQAEPPLFDKDLVDLVCYCERYIMDNWTDTPDERSRMADATINALTQLQVYRAAEREQAAPTEPQPKWERRLAKMGGSLCYNAKDDQWEVWWRLPRGDVMDTVDFGKTPKAAVEAAWKAWKEERGE